MSTSPWGKSHRSFDVVPEPEDAVEELLRAARPELPAPLSDARAQEIFARALALSSVANLEDTEAPVTAVTPPWWHRLLPQLPAAASWNWGALGMAGAVACCIGAAVYLSVRPGTGTQNAPVAVNQNRPSKPVETKPLRQAPSLIAKVDPTREPKAEPEVQRSEEAIQKPRPYRRRSRKTPFDLLRSEPRKPEATPILNAPREMVAQAEPETSRLIVIASGVPGSETDVLADAEADAEADELTAAVQEADPYLVASAEDTGERLTITVQEDVPLDHPGRAEVAAVREVPLSNSVAGPAGPAGIPSAEEGPAAPSRSRQVTLVWAESTVVTGQEPVLILTQL